MKRCVIVKAVAAMSAMILTPAVADSVFWHFNGKDGESAPTTLTDTSGTYSMTRFQITEQGHSYANQFTQDDCAGDMMCWDENGTLRTEDGIAGSIQLWRENTSGGYRRSCGYWITDKSHATETILPTNSVGEILPFTIELVFKLAPFDETVKKKNVHLFTLGRHFNYGSTGRAVLDVNVDSNGSLNIFF